VPAPQRGRVRRFLASLNQPLDPNASFGVRVLRFGCIFGALFGAFDVLILFILLSGGRYQACGKSPGSGTCDFLFLLISYPVGAFLTGAIVGAAYSVRRRLWLFIPAMILAMVPWFTAIALYDVRARAHWAIADTELVLVCSTLIGGGIGYMVWRRVLTKDRGDSERL
jgi:hypothetical protein